MTLRDDQTDTMDALRDAIRDGERRICMQAPTGYGKTILAGAIVENARRKNKKILFTVPVISLIDQTVEMFARQKIWDVGVIQATHHMTDWSQPIQIASVQTLMKRTVPQADIIMIDEAHRWFKFYERLMHKDKMPEFGNVPIIGLSATPWTKGLGSWYTRFHKASTIKQMIDAGNLSPFNVYASSHPDLEGITTVAGDYHEGQLSERMSETKLIGDAVQTWLALGEGRPTLCYAVDRAHAMKLKLQFEAAGVPCGYQDHTTKPADRAKLKRDFENGTLKVVCNVETLTTGIDWDVRCISLCRPTKSDMLFVQIVGRGLRTAPGKTDLLILDHSDNHHRLGFVTDIDESYIGLHDGKSPHHENRTEGIRLPKECPQCAYLKPPKCALCPACGFVAKVVSKIEPEAGELRELKPKPKPVKKMETMEEKGVFFAELKFYAHQHGYKDGWASNQYRDRFGVWPAGNARYFTPKLPSLETLSWIKSRQIAYAKSKARNFNEQDRRAT